MTERDALLAHVLDQPADDHARLVFADWLEEHGEGDFGRSLRAGVAASRFNGSSELPDHDFFEALLVIAEVAGAGLPARWLSELVAGPDTAGEGHKLDRSLVRKGWAVLGDRSFLTRGIITSLSQRPATSLALRRTRRRGGCNNPGGGIDSPDNGVPTGRRPGLPRH